MSAKAGNRLSCSNTIQWISWNLLSVAGSGRVNYEFGMAAETSFESELSVPDADKVTI